MSVLTIAVLPLSLLTACQSTRHNTGAAPASDRFIRADQERIMVSQMNLNRAGDQSNLTRQRTGQYCAQRWKKSARQRDFPRCRAREPMAPASEMADIGRYEPDFRQNYENNSPIADTATINIGRHTAMDMRWLPTLDIMRQIGVT